MTAKNEVCAVEGCEQQVRCRSLCSRHYRKLLKYGDPTVNLSPTRGLSLAERLWRQVDRSGGPGACWPWTGRSKHRFGYGIIWDRELGHTDGAHRVAYRLTYGEPPADRPAVRHTCDNPPCCNPAHLIAGTQVENLQDMDARSRRRTGDRKGTANNAAKLSDAKVRTIRELHKQGIGPTELARNLGVSPSAVKNVLAGNTWTHVD